MAAVELRHDLEMAVELRRTTVLVGHPRRFELAVGALVCARHLAGTVAKTLPRGWRGLEVTRFSEEGLGHRAAHALLAQEVGRRRAARAVCDRRAVHVSPLAAACLHRAGALEAISAAAVAVAEAADPADPVAAELLAGLAADAESSAREAAHQTGDAEVPAALRLLLASGACVWHGGLRIGSPSCRGDQGVDFHLTDAERAMTFGPLPPKGTAAAADATAATAAAAAAAAATAGAASASPTSFRYAELFAGIGGFRLGLDALGGRCTFASEFEKEARAQYSRAFGCALPAGDITAIPEETVPGFDLLTAGFPCQSWTSMGEAEGFADGKGDGGGRGVLFLEICRLLRAKRPAGFLLENVPNLATVGAGAALRLILRELGAAGYTVRHRCLNARPLVPQRRQRLYFVGFRRAEAAAAFQWPSWADAGDADMAEREASPGAPRPLEAAAGWPTVGEALEPMALGTAAGDAAWRAHELSAPQWRNVRAAEGRQRKPQHSLWARIVNERGAARTLIGKYKTGYIRHSQFVLPPGAGAIAPLLPGGVAEEGEEEKEEEEKDGEEGKAAAALLPRFFTRRECCRLQGFPDWYGTNDGRAEKDSLRFYHMIGNAVAPPVVKDIAAQMLAAGLMATA